MIPSQTSQALLKLFERFPKISEFIKERGWPETAVSKLLKLPESEQPCVMELLHTLPINQNKFAQVVEALAMISRRDGQSASSLLKDILETLADENDPYQKLEKTRQILSVKQHPRLEEKKKVWEACVDTLNTPAGCRIQPAPFFEDAYVDLSMRLSSIEDIKKLQACLENLVGWEKLFKLL